MKTIITPANLLGYIFTSEEYYSSSVVTNTDVSIAESRYLLPIIGEELYNRLLAGAYVELRDEYVAPMLGAWVRYIVEPLLAERCGVDHGATAVDRVRQRHLKAMATTLSHRLSDYLNANKDNFEEYNPCDNPLNHCSIDGDIVQVY